MIPLIPDPLNSYEQFLRFNHLDIEALTDSKLTDEFYALRPLLWGLSDDHWLRERVKMLEAEISKRKGNMISQWASGTAGGGN